MLAGMRVAGADRETGDVQAGVPTITLGSGDQGSA
jgi:hypothetical protein